VPNVETRPPPKAAPGTKFAPIRLSNVVVNVRRGTRVGKYLFSSMTCFPFSHHVIWNEGRVSIKPRLFADLFHGAVSDAGYNVVGDPSRVFQEARGEPEPAFVVGARIDKINMEICDRYKTPGIVPLDRQSGKIAIRVTWQVFDVLNKRIVYETATDGGAEIRAAIRDGETALFFEAFTNAASNLAGDNGFQRILSQPPSGEVLATLSKADGPPIHFRPLSPFRTPIAEHMDHVRLGVVTLSSGSGHGSGFFISPRLILTNHHVVRGREIVRVELVTGRKVLGEVLRSHPQRDVALVSVEAGGHRPLPIRTRPAVIGEDVYAIGTPLHQSLSGSVTKGIVSAYRSNEAGFEDIQADVDIQPGNSGGPLLDASGNVIGISYAGIGGTGRSVGLNLFVPLGNAIRMLGLSPEDPQTGRPTASR
jgi:S1-C subfamily serine protease